MSAPVSLTRPCPHVTGRKVGAQGVTHLMGQGAGEPMSSCPEGGLWWQFGGDAALTSVWKAKLESLGWGKYQYRKSGLRGLVRARGG